MTIARSPRNYIIIVLKLGIKKTRLKNVSIQNGFFICVTFTIFKYLKPLHFGQRVLSSSYLILECKSKELRGSLRKIKSMSLFPFRSTVLKAWRPQNGSQKSLVKTRDVQTPLCQRSLCASNRNCDQNQQKSMGTTSFVGFSNLFSPPPPPQKKNERQRNLHRAFIAVAKRYYFIFKRRPFTSRPCARRNFQIRK